jgi:hypothetical protein
MTDVGTILATMLNYFERSQLFLIATTHATAQPFCKMTERGA